MSRITQPGLDLIKSFESFVPYVYDDKRAAVRGVYREWRRGDPIKGTLTIGYGHTDAAKFDLGFPLHDVPPGFRLTEAQACHILDVDLDECEAAVNRLIKVPVTQGMYSATLSLTFNFGEGNLAKSTLLARLNRKDYAGARAAFDLYVYSKGEFMKGLQRRRDAEQALWDDRDVELPTEPVDHPEEVDQAAVPPPPSSMATSSTGNAAIVVGTTGTTTAATIAAKAVVSAVAKGGLTAAAFGVALLEQPEFWMALFAGAVTIWGCSHIWLERAAKLRTQGV